MRTKNIILTPGEYRALRKEMGLTQGELGALVGRHNSVISQREIGLAEIGVESSIALRALHADYTAKRSQSAFELEATRILNQLAGLAADWRDLRSEMEGGAE